MIVSVAATKGGVGKSTLAISIAINLARRDLKVCLIDADIQKSATNALISRESRGTSRSTVEPTLLCSTNGEELTELVQKFGWCYDHCIIDVGGKDGQSLRSALLVSDLVVTPFQPRSFDVWGLEDMGAIFGSAAMLLKRPPTWVGVLNLADPAGRDNDEAEQVAAAVPGLRLAPVRIQRRKRLGVAASAGTSVGDRGFLDLRAHDEVNHLVEFLLIARRDDLTMKGE